MTAHPPSLLSAPSSYHRPALPLCRCRAVKLIQTAVVCLPSVPRVLLARVINLVYGTMGARYNRNNNRYKWSVARRSNWVAPPPPGEIRDRNSNGGRAKVPAGFVTRKGSVLFLSFGQDQGRDWLPTLWFSWLRFAFGLWNFGGLVFVLGRFYCPQ